MSALSNAFPCPRHVQNFGPAKRRTALHKRAPSSHMFSLANFWCILPLCGRCSERKFVPWKGSHVFRFWNPVGHSNKSAVRSAMPWQPEEFTWVLDMVDLVTSLWTTAARQDARDVLCQQCSRNGNVEWFCIAAMDHCGVKFHSTDLVEKRMNTTLRQSSAMIQSSHLLRFHWLVFAIPFWQVSWSVVHGFSEETWLHMFEILCRSNSGMAMCYSHAASTNLKIWILWKKWLVVVIWS